MGLHIRLESNLGVILRNYQPLRVLANPQRECNDESLALKTKRQNRHQSCMISPKTYTRIATGGIIRQRNTVCIRRRGKKIGNNLSIRSVKPLDVQSSPIPQCCKKCGEKEEIMAVCKYCAPFRVKDELSPQNVTQPHISNRLMKPLKRFLSQASKVASDNGFILSG